MEKDAAKQEGLKENYIESIGRRKTSRARVRLISLDKQSNLRDVFLVNDKSYLEYFPTLELQTIVTSPLKLTNNILKYKIITKAVGGGIRGQAEALRLGIAKALVKIDPTFKTQLKTNGFLTRDPRMKERRKYGLKKARKGPQWAKR